MRRLRLYFALAARHNDSWLFVIFRFVRSGSGHAFCWAASGSSVLVDTVRFVLEYRLVRNAFRVVTAEPGTD